MGMVLGVLLLLIIETAPQHSPGAILHWIIETHDLQRHQSLQWEIIIQMGDYQQTHSVFFLTPISKSATSDPQESSIFEIYLVFSIIIICI